MQNILLQLDSGTIKNSLDNTVNTLIEQITPELPHTSFVTDLAFIMIIGHKEVKVFKFFLSLILFSILNL